MEYSENNGYSAEETSDSSSEDEVLNSVSDKAFFKTLSCLKNKDPSIYDNNVQFFTESVKGETTKSKKDETEKPVYVKDYVVNFIDEDDHENDKMPKELTFVEEQLATKQFFKNELENNSEDENSEVFMKIKVKNEKEKEEEDADYIDFLKGNKSELEDKEEERELKPLYDFWNKKSLDENEKFLKDYILNRRYLSTEGEADDHEDLSEDERELEEQAEFEHNYNMRFETEENLELKRFPRKIEGSMRRKDDSRKRKRAEIALRKKEEKGKKHQEIRRKQKDKLIEIEGRLEKLKELTGNLELGFKDEEILEDFDPEKHDKKMSELFNEDYYNQEEDECPVFNEDDYNWNYEDINMDCEVNDLEDGKKLTRSKKKKLKKKKAYRDIMDIAKPSFDPKVHNSFKEYFDEFYGLDCEDFIDDLPCRFKYREVVPNDYGLSVEEILMADDKELNQWVSIKKICKRRPEHVEKNEVKIYSKKAEDENLKKKIFCSLYTEEKDKPDENNLFSENKDMLADCKITSKKRKRNFKQTPDINSNQTTNGSSLDSHNDDNQQDKKHKKQKTSENVDQGNFNQFDNILKENKQMFVEESSDNNLTELDKFGSFENEINQEKEHSSGNRDPYFTSGTKVKKQNSEPYIHDKPIQSEGIRDSMFKGDKCNLNKIHETMKNNECSVGVLKKKRKKNKFGNQPNIVKESSLNDKTNVASNSKVNDLETKNRSCKRKSREARGFKQKKSRDITELSDNRLRAYGLKPKQFRAKIKYSKRHHAS